MYLLKFYLKKSNVALTGLFVDSIPVKCEEYDVIDGIPYVDIEEPEGFVRWINIPQKKISEKICFKNEISNKKKKRLLITDEWEVTSYE